MLAIIKKIFGTKNAREIKKMWPRVARINALEETFKKKSDAELQAMTPELRGRLERGDDPGGDPARGVRHRARGQRPRPGNASLRRQLIGGMVLHSGRIAEMRTGEGKTLTATLPVYTQRAQRQGVHIVRERLPRPPRRGWMGRIYKFPALRGRDLSNDRDDFEKQKATAPTSPTDRTNEFGFDYLATNMKLSPDRMVQRELKLRGRGRGRLHPHRRGADALYSSPTGSRPTCTIRVTSSSLASRKTSTSASTKRRTRRCIPTPASTRWSGLLGSTNLYDPKHIDFNHHVQQALRAHTSTKGRGVRGEDPARSSSSTSTLAARCRDGAWSDGLHQAIEAKGTVNHRGENQTAATITFQNYFRHVQEAQRHDGTAETERRSSSRSTSSSRGIPTNHAMIRAIPPTSCTRTRRGSSGGHDEIEDCHKKGQPASWWAPISVENRRCCRSCSRSAASPTRAQRQVHEMEASIVARRDARGGDHLDQHGRSRHRYRPRRQSRVHGQARLRRRRPPSTPRRSPATRRSAPRSATRSSPPGAFTSSAPNGTSRAGSTTSCAAAPAARRPGVVALLHVAAG